MKQERDEELFEYFKQELEVLQQEAQKGKIDWCFFDETGLNLNVPYAWQAKGTTALLPAQRTRGITLLGMLDPFNNKLTVNRYEGATNAKCVIQTLDEFSLNLPKKTILILDHASIHKAGIVKQQETKWRQRGLFLQFIPAYSPELNLIEILWKRLKHSWLKPQYYASLEYLMQQTDRILSNYGQHYAISFC